MVTRQVRPSWIAGISALTMLAAGGFATPAKAVPTTYAVSGTLTWSPTNIDTIVGTFTYNPTGGVTTVDVVLTSTGGFSQEAGTWNGTATYDAPNRTIFSQAGPANLYLVLGLNLATVPLTETITGVTWICGFGCRADTTSVTATASSAPEPASIALLGKALTVIPLTTRSRLRRTAASLQRLLTWRLRVGRSR